MIYLLRPDFSLEVTDRFDFIVARNRGICHISDHKPREPRKLSQPALSHHGVDISTVDSYGPQDPILETVSYTRREYGISDDADSTRTSLSIWLDDRIQADPAICTDLCRVLHEDSSRFRRTLIRGVYSHRTLQDLCYTFYTSSEMDLVRDPRTNFDTYRNTFPRVDLSYVDQRSSDFSKSVLEELRKYTKQAMSFGEGLASSYRFRGPSSEFRRRPGSFAIIDSFAAQFDEQRKSGLITSPRRSPGIPRFNLSLPISRLTSFDGFLRYDLGVLGEPPVLTHHELSYYKLATESDDEFLSRVNRVLRDLPYIDRSRVNLRFHITQELAKYKREHTQPPTDQPTVPPSTPTKSSFWD